MLRRIRRRRIALALVALGGVCLAEPAGAYKWTSCPPPPPPLNPSALGATTSPFAHPGREISIVLNDAEVLAHGGFSTAEGGNELLVRFDSLFGDAVDLAPRSLAAVSPSVLTFAFPDAPAEIGRTLAGPAEISVRVDGRRVAHVLAADFVGLPAAVDVSGMLAGTELEGVVHAAIGADGDLWLPVHFSGKPMGGMPGCDGDDFIMPMPIEIGGSTVVGDMLFPFDPTCRIRRMSGYLGDMVLNGSSFYGLLYPEPIQLRQVGDTLGVSVCRLNDAEDLVLRVQGDQSWAQPRSPFRLVARDSAALALKLQTASRVPRSVRAEARTQSDLAPGRVDSFGSQCAALPEK